MEQTIKDFYGKIIGYVQVDASGNKTLRDFGRRILGTYDARANVTKDFHGRIVGQGDCLTMLLSQSFK